MTSLEVEDNITLLSRTHTRLTFAPKIVPAKFYLTWEPALGEVHSEFSQSTIACLYLKWITWLCHPRSNSCYICFANCEWSVAIFL